MCSLLFQIQFNILRIPLVYTDDVSSTHWFLSLALSNYACTSRRRTFGYSAKTYPLETTNNSKKDGKKIISIPVDFRLSEQKQVLDSFQVVRYGKNSKSE